MKKIIVDIDGTISMVGDRLKYLQQTPKDWDAFYDACDEDRAIIPIVMLVDLLSGRCGYDVVFCTGRVESVRSKTKDWLNDFFFNTPIEDKNLLMRKDGDKRHDEEVKPELLEEAGICVEDVAFILEDRNSVVKRWRELGFICLQPADGDF